MRPVTRVPAVIRMAVQTGVHGARLRQEQDDQQDTWGRSSYDALAGTVTPAARAAAHAAEQDLATGAGGRWRVVRTWDARRDAALPFAGVVAELRQLRAQGHELHLDLVLDAPEGRVAGLEASVWEETAPAPATDVTPLRAGAERGGSFLDADAAAAVAEQFGGA